MLDIDQLQLTPEQINLIPEYRHKWQKVALNREPLDRDRAIMAINHLYSWLNLPHPNLIFFTSPSDAIAYLCNEIDNSWANLASSTLGSTLAVTLLNNLLGQFRTKVKAELIQELGIRLDED